MLSGNNLVMPTIQEQNWFVNSLTKMLRPKGLKNIGFHSGCPLITRLPAKNPFIESRYKDYRIKIIVAYCVPFPADANNGTTRYILNRTVYQLRNNILKRATRVSGLDLALFTAA